MEYAMRISDWSSDVCSSDLNHQHRSDRHRVIKVMHASARLRPGPEPLAQVLVARRVAGADAGGCAAQLLERSEDRRVGKEGVSTRSSRWSPYHDKKNTNKHNPRKTTRHTTQYNAKKP